MNVRVNLLPREVEERNRARQARVALAAAALSVLVVLALGYLYQVGRVNDAQARLAAEQAKLAEIEADRDDLREFEALAVRADAANASLAGALSDEVSMAGILQDVAAVMPPDSELTTLAVTAETPDPENGNRLGTITATGRSKTGHAPGLERLLLQFDKVAAFRNVFFTTSTLDEDGNATFAFDLDLGPEVLTGRYVNGLPEELR